MKEIKKFTEEFAEYLKDESRLEGKADYISFPEREADVIDIVRHCQREKLPLTIQGSRTGITGGSVPEGGIVLNLEKMNRILGIRKDPKGNWYLRCQPGLKLLELRQILADRHSLDITDWQEVDKQLWSEFSRECEYFYPPDPTETSASLGGMAACNASGARSFKYGATRNWISNLKVVSLRKVSIDELDLNSAIQIKDGMKNAAGYYLKAKSRRFDHFIGSEGTLGVITELELKLERKPAYCWGVLQFFGKESQAICFSEQLRKAHQASALEYFGKNSLQLLRKHPHLWKGLPGLKTGWLAGVYYEFESDAEEEVEEFVFSAGELAETFGSSESDCWIVDTGKGIDQLKEFRHAVPEAINHELDELKQLDKRLAKISTDLVVPEGKLEKMVDLYRQAEQTGWAVFVFGHIGDNHLHTNILPQNYREYIKGKEIVEDWAKEAVSAGGSVSGEHGIGKAKKTLLQMMYGNAGIEVFKKVKDIYDPNWLLNRGNMLFYEDKQRDN